MKLHVIITCSTWMVGEGVLHECFTHPDVEKVLLLNRRPSGVKHHKVTEILLADFSNITPVQDRLSGYNACFFCAGVSSIGVNEEQYTALTYDLTIHVATALVKANPAMIFSYVSGAGTDSTEKGRSMWARVKGKTENELARLGFKHAYAFRPGFMQPTPGLKNTLKIYNYISWMFPLLRKVAKNHVSTLAELGQAMIKAALYQPNKKILEVKDIVELAHANR
jgi:hypothetical protein